MQGSCRLDLRSYPMDTQYCSTIVESCKYCSFLLYSDLSILSKQNKYARILKFSILRFHFYFESLYFSCKNFLSERMTIILSSVDRLHFGLCVPSQAIE